jgi:O-antigen/teichoic acid export membrane protein
MYGRNIISDRLHMSEFKKSLKSSSARLIVNVLGQIINTFGNIAVVPLFLHYWTKLEYGEWLVLTAVPSLLWSLEGGFAGLAVSRMMLSSAVGDWKGANKLFQNIVVIQLLVSAVIIMGGAILVREVNFRPFFAITKMSHHDAASVLVVMLFYMSFGWCINLLRAPYFAAERSPRGFMMVNLWRLTDFLVIGGTLILHGRAPMVAAAETANAALWVALASFDISRKCPQFKFGLRDVSWSVAKTVFRDGIPLFLSQAGNAFYLQGYPLVLGRTLGALAVVNFSAIRTVTRVFLQATIVCTTAASLELSKSYATKKWDIYMGWLKMLTATILVGSVCACLLLFFAGPTVIEIWTHGKVSVSGPLLLLFGFSVAIQAGWTVFFMLLYTANKHHAQCYAYFAITIGALFVGDLTIGRFGFTAVPVIMIAADVLVLASCISLCVRYLREVHFLSVLEVLWPSFYIEKATWAFGKIRLLKLPSFNR